MPGHEDAIAGFLNAIGYDEEPMGMFFTDEQPAEGFSPDPMELPTAEREARNEINWEEVFKNHSCVLKNIWLARKKGTAAYFDSARHGCPGAAFYLGFTRPLMETIVHFVSTGIPGVMENCERYIDSPDIARRFYNEEMAPIPAPKRFCVFKPLSHFVKDGKPLLVSFFARPETMAGLFGQTFFVTNDKEAVISPAGSGCALLVTWPFKYVSQGKLKAFMGGWDPSCRPFLKTDEITFTVPYELFERMVNRSQESFLNGPSWSEVKKRVRKSKEVWNKDGGNT